MAARMWREYAGNCSKGGTARIATVAEEMQAAFAINIPLLETVDPSGLSAT